MISSLEPDKAFKLVISILNNKSDNEDHKLKGLLDALNKFTAEELYPHLNIASPGDSSNIVDRFQQELERFEAFAANPDYGRKHLIGLGGAFSSGKSTILNTLLGDKVLPTDIDPTTAVPTFLMHSEVQEIGAINIFNARVNLDLESFKAIGHEFNKAIGLEFNDEYNVELGHLLKTAFISLPNLRYEHIAFLDTPGYSKPNTDEYSDRTDEAIARNQLMAVDAIIWVVEVKEGLTQSDIDFLQSLERRVPILIIINKADKVTPEGLAKVQNHLLHELKTKGFQVDDVIPFSNKGSHPFEPIDHWLSKWNISQSKVSFPRTFKSLFSEFRKHYQQELGNAKKRMSRINVVDSFVNSADHDVIKIAIQDIYDEAINDVRKYKDLENKLLTLCSQFFQILKEIGDYVKIELPEPSEIDMISDSAFSINTLLQDYKTKHNLKESSLNEYILNQFSSVQNLDTSSVRWFPSIKHEMSLELELTKQDKRQQAINRLQQALVQLNNTSIYNLATIMKNLDSELQKLRYED